MSEDRGMIIKRATIALAGLYALGGVVAFGHAAAAKERQVDADYASCIAKSDPTRLCMKLDERAPISGVMAGMLWPLYFSWEAFS